MDFIELALGWMKLIGDIINFFVPFIIVYMCFMIAEIKDKLSRVSCHAENLKCKLEE